MSTLIVKDKEQGRALSDLARWFDTESSSLHHALVTMAQRNEADALDAEVVKFPAVVAVLTESAARWRAIATRMLDLSEKLGDPDDIHHSY